ncbi:MAG: copper resistance protein CopC [Candidatus Paceibacterota bacterium]
MRKIVALTLLILTFALPTYSFADGGSGSSTIPNLIPPPEATMPLEDDLGTNYVRTIVEPPAKTPKVKLISSWPKENIGLLAKPREARLTFDKQVRPIDVTLQVKRIDIDDQWQNAVRTETDPDLKSVRFSLPNMSIGAYKIKWKAGESTGEFNFRVKDPISAPGGGNHRHDSGLLNGFPWFERVAVALTTLILAGAFITFKRRTIFYSVMLVIIAISATVRSYQLVEGASILDNGDKSWAKGLSSAGVWSWFIILGITLLIASSIRASLGVRLIAASFVGYLQATALNAHTVAPKFILGVTYALLLAVTVLAVKVTLDKKLYSRNFTVMMYILLGLISFIALWSRTNFGVITNDFREALINRVIQVMILLTVTLLPSWLSAIKKNNIISSSGAVNLSTKAESTSREADPVGKNGQLLLEKIKVNGNEPESELDTPSEKKVRRFISKVYSLLIKRIAPLVTKLGGRDNLLLILQVILILLIATPSPLAAGLGGDRL